MHKMLLCAMAIALATFPFLGGCSDDLKYVSDGDFKYCYIKDIDSYAIIGTTEQGNQNEVLYFSAYYKKKLVTQMGCSGKEALMGGNIFYWSCIRAIASKAYFPYGINSEYPDGITFELNKDRQLYFANSNAQYLKSAVTMAYLNVAKYYVTQSAYDYIMSDNGIENRGDIHVANTSFLFNYENAPNKDYFFINNFDNGGLIENTPYEPKRDGYTFGGWYKDPTCETAWNFMSDTLPQMQFDEEGKEIFQETRLYAKWIKN